MTKTRWFIVTPITDTPTQTTVTIITITMIVPREEDIMVSTMVTTLATTKRSMVTIIIMDTPHRYGKLKFAICKNNANTNLEDLVNEFYYLFTH